SRCGSAHTSRRALLTSMPIDSVPICLATLHSARRACRVWPDLVDASSRSRGSGNCSGCPRDERGDLASRRSCRTRERAACSVRIRRASSLAERSSEIQGARSDERAEQRLAAGAAGSPEPAPLTLVLALGARRPLLLVRG